jgi:hypothetical protein
MIVKLSYLDRFRCSEISKGNGNMTPQQVRACLEQGSTVCANGNEYQMHDAAERWDRKVKSL